MRQDKIEKFLAYEGKISITCISSTNLVEQARKIHDLSPTVTAALGRVLTITTIMGADLKGKQDTITVQIKGSGPIENMSVVANSKGEVKAYIKNPHVEVPLKENGKIDVGGAVGNTGFINVIKDIGLKEPYVGMSPLVSGEIAEDFAHYFFISEQKPTAVALGVLVNQQGVKASGGYVITAMPDADEQTIAKLEKNLSEILDVSTMLDKQYSLEQIAKEISKDENLQKIGEPITPIYHCDCNKEKIDKGLISLGRQELEKMIQEENEIEITCQFCHQTYHFTKQELEQLAKTTK